MYQHVDIHGQEARPSSVILVSGGDQDAVRVGSIASELDAWKCRRLKPCEQTVGVLVLTVQASSRQSARLVSVRLWCWTFQKKICHKKNTT